MKQAARMQQQMEQVQAQLAARTVEAPAAAARSRLPPSATAASRPSRLIRRRSIQPNAQLLEDMIVTAANQALGQAKDISNTEMGKVTAGLSLPGLM